MMDLAILGVLVIVSYYLMMNRIVKFVKKVTLNRTLFVLKILRLILDVLNIIFQLSVI